MNVTALIEEDHGLVAGNCAVPSERWVSGSDASSTMAVTSADGSGSV